jgi:hypothetical protein
MAWNPGVMHLRCLLVDDNEHFIEAARVLLRRQGIDVVGSDRRRPTKEGAYVEHGGP